MTILAIDTSTPILKIGVYKGRLIQATIVQPPLTHAEQIIPAIEETFRKAGIAPANAGLIAVAGGPGSFTGLRIGIATAKGLSLALGIPLVLVPTLDIYGFAWREMGGIVVPVIDARKHRIYCARYSHGQNMGELMDIKPDQLLPKIDAEEEVHFIGPDADLLESICLERPGWIIHEPDAEKEVAAIAELGLRIFEEKGPADDAARPIYLREPEIGIPLAR